MESLYLFFILDNIFTCEYFFFSFHFRLKTRIDRHRHVVVAIVQYIVVDKVFNIKFSHNVKVRRTEMKKP